MVRCAVAALFGGALLVAMPADGATADAAPPPPVAQQTLNDAWWTGPMLTPSAATLPRGHFLIEPYLYDVVSSGSHGFGSLTYLNYGLADRFTIGLIPTAGFTKVSDGPSSSGIGLEISACWLSTGSRSFAAAVGCPPLPSWCKRHFLPEGSTAWATARATASEAEPTRPPWRSTPRRTSGCRTAASSACGSTWRTTSRPDVSLEGASVYGTETGFSGRAKPGRSFSADASWEYSVTRSWVLALDVIYRHRGTTRVAGDDVRDPNASPVQLSSGPADTVAIAPAIEYSWKSNWGVLLGVRVIPGTRHAATSVTPAEPSTSCTDPRASEAGSRSIRWCRRWESNPHTPKRTGF